ncbi:uncharacterized protein Bfra_008182 [Botrytis fragariae]|uniref:Uncharacterized protein n=1 Tax=Botrytis fragariae TaxID=1964551 RepID=A0A8H6AT23_9HELO|nr:uncharacterized protein Bfra_008182 [Botrytis fragariae]KAF5872905.1 hypothetical protein Bfra_008182 [Botrytis fragariae]
MHSLRRVFALVQPKPWLYPVRFLRMKIWRKKTTYIEDGLKWLGWQALVHVLSFGDVLKCIVEGFHGLRSSRRNAIMAHYVDAGIEGRASPYKTKDLSEALDLVDRGPDEH